MEEKKTLRSNCRRRFLIQAPVLTFGLMACLRSNAQAASGNYRRRIDTDTCVSCGACVDACPTEAIQEGNDSYLVNPNLCVGCGACDAECPTAAIEQGTLIVVPTVYADDCLECGSCAASCATGAITLNSTASINPALCSGCRDCVDACPVAAIS